MPWPREVTASSAWLAGLFLMAILPTKETILQFKNLVDQFIRRLDLSA